MKANNARQVGLSRRPGGAIKIGCVISEAQAFQHAAQNASDAIHIDRHSVTTHISGDIAIRRGTHAADTVTQSSVTP